MHTVGSPKPLIQNLEAVFITADPLKGIYAVREGPLEKNVRIAFRHDRSHGVGKLSRQHPLAFASHNLGPAQASL